MKEHYLVPSMSRAGNCHDNAVAESFFATIKKRIVKRKIYSTREDVKAEIFNFIEMFYNPKKRQSHTGGVSPAKFKEAYFSGTFIIFIGCRLVKPKVPPNMLSNSLVIRNWH